MTKTAAVTGDAEDGDELDPLDAEPVVSSGSAQATQRRAAKLRDISPGLGVVGERGIDGGERRRLSGVGGSSKGKRGNALRTLGFVKGGSGRTCRSSRTPGGVGWPPRPSQPPVARRGGRVGLAGPIFAKWATVPVD